MKKKKNQVDFYKQKITLIKKEYMNKIGFFAITANPPHLGHLKVVQQALDKFDEIWVSPVYIHPMGEGKVTYENRLEMTKLLFAEMPKEKVKIKEIDKEYQELNGKPPYSYELLNFIKEKYSFNASLILGVDNFYSEKWKNFYKHHKVTKDFGVALFSDIGIHSSTIRELIDEGKWMKVEVACGKAVADFLKNNLVSVAYGD